MRNNDPSPKKLLDKMTSANKWRQGDYWYKEKMVRYVNEYGNYYNYGPVANIPYHSNPLYSHLNTDPLAWNNYRYRNAAGQNIFHYLLADPALFPTDNTHLTPRLLKKHFSSTCEQTIYEGEGLKKFKSHFTEKIAPANKLAIKKINGVLTTASNTLEQKQINELFLARDNHNNTPFHYALYHKAPIAIQMTILKIFDSTINSITKPQRQSLLLSPNMAGYNIVMLAYRYGAPKQNEAAIQWMDNVNKDPQYTLKSHQRRDTEDSNSTLIHYAMRSDNQETIDSFKACFANEPDALKTASLQLDAKHITALHLTCSNGDETQLRELFSLFTMTEIYNLYFHQYNESLLQSVARNDRIGQGNFDPLIEEYTILHEIFDYLRSRNRYFYQDADYLARLNDFKEVMDNLSTSEGQFIQDVVADSKFEQVQYSFFSIFKFNGSQRYFNLKSRLHNVVLRVEEKHLTKLVSDFLDFLNDQIKNNKCAVASHLRGVVNNDKSTRGVDEAKVEAVPPVVYPPPSAPPAYSDEEQDESNPKKTDEFRLHPSGEPVPTLKL